MNMSLLHFAIASCAARRTMFSLPEPKMKRKASTTPSAGDKIQNKIKK
jgi:hypothetical protein